MKISPKSKTGRIAKADWKYMLEKPDGDPGFNPMRNKQIIEDTIKKTDKRIMQLKKEYSEQVEERVDAVSYYLKSLMRHKTYASDPRKAAEYYFGRKELARLRGDEIREQIMNELRQNAGIMKN